MAGNHRSGRRPKPDAWRVLEGKSDWRAQQHKTLPTTLGLPPVPEELQHDALALAYWQTLGAQLDAMGVMAHEYGHALATLACVSADYERTRDQFRRINFQAFHTEKRGDSVVVVESPMLKRLNELALLRVRLLGEFGMSPVMATKVYGKRESHEPKKWDVLAGPR